MIERIEFHGYIIEPSLSYFGGFDFYPKDEGRDDDYDWTGDGWKNCGNVGFASSIEEAKDAIWERNMMRQPQHIVVLHNKKYPFDWIEDAIKFCVMWSAEEFIPAANP